MVRGKRTTSLIISIIMICSLFCTSIAAATNPIDNMTDIPEDYWARSAIEKCMQEGILNGQSETSFAPEVSMSRAEFTQMVYNKYKDDEILKSQRDVTFNDVESDKWFAQAVKACANAKIINGIGDGKFNPDGKISRQDAVLILSRINFGSETIDKLTDKDAQDKLDELKKDDKEFSDVNSIADYAKKGFIISIGVIINGNVDGTLNPLGNMRRAEAAQMMYNYIFVNAPDPETTETTGETPDATSETGEDPDLPDPPVTPQVQEDAFLFMGDSITNGYGLDVQAEERFSNLFDKSEDHVVTAENVAIDGLTAPELLSKVKTAQYANKIKKSSYVSISIGGNDLMHAGFPIICNAIGMEPTDDLISIGIALLNSANKQKLQDYLDSDQGKLDIKTLTIDYKNDLNQIISRIHQANPNCKIYIQTIYNPLYESSIGGSFAPMLDYFTLEYNKMINSVASSSVKIIDIYTLFKNNIDKGLTNIGGFDIHPNKLGHEYISKAYSDQYAIDRPKDK